MYVTVQLHRTSVTYQTGHPNSGGIFEQGPRRVVSHHVPVGSHLRAEGSNCDRGAAADGVQGQYLFVNLAGAFAFVVVQLDLYICHLSNGPPPFGWDFRTVPTKSGSHHLPVGSCPRAEGSNCDRGAAADGVQG